MNRCIITCAVGSWYHKGFNRLCRSLDRVGFGGNLIAWINEYPPGSPTHADNPYAFKVYAFMEARSRGYESALWLDSSCWAIRPVEPLFDEIEQDGYLFFNGGWATGQWCSDPALPILGVTRDEAMTIPMLAATAMGLKFLSAKATAFVADWQRACWDGAFRGPWRNDRGEASPDPRVTGHRHDQTAASIFAHRHGMELTDCPEFFAYWSQKPDPRTCVVARGMRGDESDSEVTNDLCLA